MSHGIETCEDGRATAAYLETAAWHKLGEVVPIPMGGKDMLELAHMNDLDYRMEPLLVRIGGDLVDTGKLTTTALNPFDRSQRRIIGGYLTEGFTLEAPETVMEFSEALTEEGVQIAAVGLLNSGRRMFVSMKVTDLMLGGVDQTGQYLLFATGFDGSLATTVKLLNFRVECANLLDIGLGTRTEYTFRAKHTSNIGPRVDEARAVLKMAWKATEEFDAEVRMLLDREVSDKAFYEIVKEFIPLPQGGSKTMETRVAQARASVIGNWKFGNARSITGTAWGAINALTEYVDHQSGNRPDDANRWAASFMDESMRKERAKAKSLVVKTLSLV